MESVLHLYVLYTFIGIGACELCYTSLFTTKYCTYGCCGNSFDEYCCPYNLGVYIGVGVTCSIIFIVAVVVFLIYMCHRSNRPGRVVNAAPNTSVAAVTTISANDRHYQTHTTMYQQHPPGMYPPPPGPGYNGAAYPPPPGPGYNGAAYPPPPGPGYNGAAYPPPPGPGYSGAAYPSPPTVTHPPGYTPLDSKPPSYT